MPTRGTANSDSEWDAVTVLRKKTPGAGAARSAQAVAQARRHGDSVDTVEKFGGSGNRQHTAAKDTAKLDRETEELKHKTVSLSLSRLIMQARVDKGMSQKDLATKINEKPQVINEYEAGKAIPNQQILGRIERALGVHLRGKNMGEALSKPGDKKPAAAAKGKKK